MKAKKMSGYFLFALFLVFAVLAYIKIKDYTLKVDDGELKSKNEQSYSLSSVYSEDNPDSTNNLDSTNSRNIPVLMYHHLDEKGDGPDTISKENFQRQMKCLKDNGYQPVSFEELINYVYNDGSLPDKPICITFDDGYYSNYEIAYPILKEYQFKATIFPIGVSIGKEHYKETSHKIIPHFDIEEIKEMESSGLISIQSHTYDMHQSKKLEKSENPRDTILPFEDESEEDYRKAITDDFRKMEEILKKADIDSIDVLAYPKGVCCELTESVLSSLGVKVTLTIDFNKVNTITRGEPQTLKGMGRLGVDDDITNEDLIEYLEKITQAN